MRTISQDVYGNEFWGCSPKEIWTNLKFESQFVDNECCDQRGFIQYVSSNRHGFIQFSGLLCKIESIIGFPWKKIVIQKSTVENRNSKTSGAGATGSWHTSNYVHWEGPRELSLAKNLRKTLLFGQQITFFFEWKWKWETMLCFKSSLVLERMGNF